MALVGLAPHIATAQISFTNIALPRVGRDPDEGRFLPDEFAASASRFSLFDQFSLDWSTAPLRLGFRYETYTASDTLVTHYHAFVRRWATWNGEHFEATVGHYEAMFGRGLVLRAFELPGVVREEFGTPQFGDSRDLDGVKLRGNFDRGEIVALAGEPRFADQDPTVERRGQVEGASGRARLMRGVHAGGSYLRLDSRNTGPGSRPEVAGGFAQIAFDPWLERAGLERVSLDTYAEYDQVSGLDLPAAVSSPRAQTDAGYGVYVSQSLILDDVIPGLRWGTSYEYKDYQNFELGVNEPPTLVREHAFALLNRTTHVLTALQEQGYQLETRFTFHDALDLVLNWSRAENARSRRFSERYAELSGHWQGRTLTFFADTALDGNEAVHDRDTFGAYAQAPLRGPHSVEVELERMRIERGSGLAAADIDDRYAALTYAWADRFSLAAIRQTTDDPNEATDPHTGEIARRAYDSLHASVDFGSHHQLLCVWGRTRGGLACVAGTCYKVRSFAGISAQLTTRF